LEDHIGPSFAVRWRENDDTDFSSHAERDKLRLLLQYSRKLSVFQKRATLVQECLEEVLENGASRPSTLSAFKQLLILFSSIDEDLAAMYLTAKIEHNPRDADDHEEVELLLESFSKQCEEIVSEVETLSARRVSFPPALNDTDSLFHRPT
jgi:magnesium transporter